MFYLVSDYTVTMIGSNKLFLNLNLNLNLRPTLVLQQCSACTAQCILGFVHIGNGFPSHIYNEKPQTTKKFQNENCPIHSSLIQRLAKGREDLTPSKLR